MNQVCCQALQHHTATQAGMLLRLEHQFSRSPVLLVCVFSHVMLSACTAGSLGRLLTEEGVPASVRRSTILQSRWRPPLPLTLLQTMMPLRSCL